MPRLVSSVFALFALFCFVAAQGPSSLPECAQNCANTASKAAGCAITDIPCLCSHQSFISATLQCSHSTCGLEDQSSASGVLEEMCAAIPPPNSTSTSTSTSASSTRPAPSSSPSHTSSPIAPSPRPQNPPPTPTPIVSPAPLTTTVHDGTTTVISPATTPPGTTLIPATGNVTTVVMNTVTSPLPSGNAAGELVRGGWAIGLAAVLGLAVL